MSLTKNATLSSVLSARSTLRQVRRTSAGALGLSEEYIQAAEGGNSSWPQLIKAKRVVGWERTFRSDYLDVNTVDTPVACVAMMQVPSCQWKEGGKIQRHTQWQPEL